jgi:hypothetical protein
MSRLKIMFCLSISLIFYQFALSQEIDSIKIIQSSPSIHDSVLFATFSEPFSGDCNYLLKLDSIASNKIYISGKYDSNIKCLTNGANDTINFGLLPEGNYTIYFSFIDTYGFIETNETTLNFIVSQSTGLNNSYQKKISVSPNPCNSYLTISNLPDMSEKKMIRIFSSTGQKLLEKNIYSFDSEITIDMNNYEMGIYFLTIGNEITNLKIIKE